MANEGPIPLADGVDAVAEGSIWFVHGLRGDAIKTWSKDGVCWSRDLLPQELPNVRIFTWGYDSSVANFSGSVSQASIFGHGENLLRDIASKRGPAEKDRALIFVGHSLGGLVVKQALIRSAQYFYNQEDERLGLIYQHTEALIFLGTPHRGSDKAELGQMVANIAKVSLRQPNSKLIRALSRESDVLEQQRQAFASVSSNILIACFYEEMPTSFRKILRVNLGVIVPEHSASIDGFGIERIRIRASHSDMRKFSNVLQLGFQRVLDRLKDYVHRAEEQVAASAEQVQLVEMAQEEEREIARTELIKSLEFDGMNFEEDAVTDAHWNTFQWLFEASSSQSESLEGNGPATFVPWLRSSAPFYWITGKAGSGKSTLMKFIFTHPEFDRNPRCWAGNCQLIRAKFFIINRAPSALQKSGEGLLRTLLIQLLKASPAFMWIINEYTVVESWSWRTLRKAFRACLEHKPPGIKICFIIDGLDEYNIPAYSSDPHRQDRKYSKQQKGFEEIVEFFLDTKKYPGVKFCLASRPLVVFEDELKAFPHFYIHELTKNDMRNFIEDRLAKRDAQLGLLEEPNAKEEIKRIIQDKANGVFLWVRLVIDRTLQRLRNRDNFASIEAELRRVPDELGGPTGLYALMLLDDVAPEDRGEGIRILFHILTCQEGLPLPALSLEIAEQLGDGGEFSINSMRDLYPRLLLEKELGRRIDRFKGRVRSCCAGLAEAYEHVNYQSYRFIHETIQEFLNGDIWANPKLQNLAAGRVETHLRVIRANLTSLFLAKTSFAPSDSLILVFLNISSHSVKKFGVPRPHYRPQLCFGIFDEMRYIVSLISSRYEESNIVFFGNHLSIEEALALHLTRHKLGLEYMQTRTGPGAFLINGRVGPRSRPLLDLMLCFNYNNVFLDVVQELLESTADPNQNWRCKSVWHWYLHRCIPGLHFGECILLMLEHGADLRGNVTMDDSLAKKLLGEMDEKKSLSKAVIREFSLSWGRRKDGNHSASILVFLCAFRHKKSDEQWQMFFADEPLLNRSSAGGWKLNSYMKQYLLDGEEEELRDIYAGHFPEDASHPYSTRNLRVLMGKEIHRDDETRISEI